MFRLIVQIVVFITMAIGFVGCSTSMLDTQVRNKQARIIIEVPSNVDEETLKHALKEAIALRVSSLKENENLFPEELPQKPPKPEINKQFKKLAAVMGRGMNAAMQYRSRDLSNAWYSIGGSGGMTSEYLNRAEYYKAGIYPYKDGYKIYIYQFYTEGTDGILGNLTSAAVDAIVGSDGALLYMAQVRDAFINDIPIKTINQSPKKLEKINLNAIGWNSTK